MIFNSSVAVAPPGRSDRPPATGMHEDPNVFWRILALKPEKNNMPAQQSSTQSHCTCAMHVANKLPSCEIKSTA
jgi:hypothetical protein